MAAGSSHACYISTSGSLFCWGEANFGRLGRYTAGAVTAPPLSPELSGVTIVAAACGALPSGGLAPPSPHPGGQEPSTQPLSTPPADSTPLA